MFFVLQFCLTSACAEVGFNWGSEYSGRIFREAIQSNSGDGETETVFFVQSYGKGKMTLSQIKGTCTELSYTKLFSGAMGTAEEWGKYTIEVAHEDSGTYKVYQWDKTFNNDSYTIKFDRPGAYYVYVRPYTQSEMTASWTLDRFGAWSEPPYWWIDSKSNCTIISEPTYGMR